MTNKQYILKLLAYLFGFAIVYGTLNLIVGFEQTVIMGLIVILANQQMNQNEQ